MSYVERSLAPGEHIIYRTKLHPVVFFWPLLFIPISAAAFLTGRENLAQISLALVVVLEVYGFFQRYFSDFAVTNRRVIGKFFGYRVAYLPEMMLVELRTVEFKPGVLNVLFDYGRVIATDIRGERHEFYNVPGEFYRHIQARLARIERILK
ncbi:MAG TPA: hypothetical protein VGH16_19685 [Candidatus Binatia bacterium]